MFVTTGTVEHVLEWFRVQHCYTFLLLVISSGEKSEPLLDTLCRYPNEIDTATRRRIAVVLFGGGADAVIELQKDSSHLTYVPGLLLTGSRDGHVRDEAPARAVRAMDIRDERVRRELVNSNHAVAVDLAELFNIPSSKLPALFLLHKDIEEPLVIEITPEADLGPIRDFLEELRTLEAPRVTVPTVGSGDFNASLRRTYQRLEQARERVASVFTHWSAAVRETESTNSFLQHAMNSQPLWSVGEYRDRLKLALASKGFIALIDGDAHLRELTHNFQSDLEHLEHVEQELERKQGKKQVYRDQLLQAEAAHGELERYQQELENIAKKYEALFVNGSSATLARMLQVTSGVLLVVQQVLVILEKLKNISGD